MTDTDPVGAWPDELDTRILAGLRGLHGRLDPPPPGLAEQMMLAMAVAGLDAELAAVSQERLAGSGARASEHVRTITFDTVSLTVMVAIVERADERVRLDGWLAPPAALRLELRLPQAGGRSQLEATADDSGRFVFPAVPRGLVWLTVYRDESDESAVVTPTFEL
ncbi:MAG: hypothetical protein AUG49_11515 [Catenulispora sp. 13_1_20CM_3_70_7]|jgi:hypothetical protein|nr:MAG: hypothetical protein AUG49_11515 [Catenulispora sp. 13_1_20CM_3_70_7]